MRLNKRWASRIRDRVSLSPNGIVKQSATVGCGSAGLGFGEVGDIIFNLSASVFDVEFYVQYAGRVGIKTIGLAVNLCWYGSFTASLCQVKPVSAAYNLLAAIQPFPNLNGRCQCAVVFAFECAFLGHAIGSGIAFELGHILG